LPFFGVVITKHRRGAGKGSPVVETENEGTLVERAKEDPTAFGVLYEKYVRKIYSYIYCRTGNRCDAEDLTARTFYRLSPT